ncbi:MAG: hypothetical protein KatS3mg105_0361 [Gemmatales bacterium]|nr:MAG: hypothetical protein KatS3mg105_0361 [Gemmatales bacterium]
MQHPFDGLIVPAGNRDAHVPTRRAALGQMLLGTAGLVGIQSAALAQARVKPTTEAVGEEGGRRPPIQATTLALGEEGGQATLALGEQGGGRTTKAVGEEGGARTRALNEQGGRITTQAVGEEGAARTVKPASVDVPEKVLEQAWQQLADDKLYQQGYQTIYMAKQGVPFLKKKLKPQRPPERQKVENLIRDLDSNSFQKRDQATRQLRALGPAVVGMLMKAQASPASLEQKKRLEALIKELSTGPVAQAKRALTLLVSVGTKEAKSIVHELAKGDEDSWLTQEAKRFVK